MPWLPVPVPFPASSSCPPLAGWPEKVSLGAGPPWPRGCPSQPSSKPARPAGAQASRRGDAGSPWPLTHALCLGQPGHMCSHHHSAGKGGSFRFLLAGERQPRQMPHEAPPCHGPPYACCKWRADVPSRPQLALSFCTSLQQACVRPGGVQWSTGQLRADVAEVGIGLAVTLLPQLPECWHDKIQHHTYPVPIAASG